ncbi:hypothetical protein GCM10025794_02180 [Massilia kyonggiensis]
MWDLFLVVVIQDLADQFTHVFKIIDASIDCWMRFPAPTWLAKGCAVQLMIESGMQKMVLRFSHAVKLWLTARNVIDTSAELVKCLPAQFIPIFAIVAQIGAGGAGRPLIFSDRYAEPCAKINFARSPMCYR